MFYLISYQKWWNWIFLNLLVIKIVELMNSAIIYIIPISGLNHLKKDNLMKMLNEDFIDFNNSLDNLAIILIGFLCLVTSFIV